MSREYTIFQFDVDEATLRRVLASIPGVTPLPPDESSTVEDGSAPAGPATRAATGPTDEERSGATPPDSAGEAGDEPPGAEAHLHDSMAANEEHAGATTWTAPSTPWPGAPTEREESEGFLDRLRSKRALLVGGVVAVLGAVGAAAVWFLKFRDDGGADSSRDEPEREPHADDSDSRSYPVDVAPVVGIAFLAVGTVVLRQIRGGDGD